MDRSRISQFEVGGEKLIKAIAGLSKPELLWKPQAAMGIGLWSIQQVVFHLMDDELIWSARMKLVIAEDKPKILGYDESKFASHLFCEEGEAAAAAQVLDLNRRQFSIMLKNLPDAAFERTGEHNDIGNFTLAQAVKWTTEHLDHHIHYIQMKREKLGK